MTVRYINLTPHALYVKATDGEYITILPDADGNPVNGQMDEKAIGQPDYYSRNLTLLNEGALTQTLAHYA